MTTLGPLEACSVVRESAPSSVEDLLAIAIRDAEAIGSEYILEVHVRALESTSSFNLTLPLETEISSRSSEVHATLAHPELTQRHIRLAELAGGSIGEQVGSQGPPPYEKDVAHVETKMDLGAVESDI